MTKPLERLGMSMGFFRLAFAFCSAGITLVVSSFAVAQPSSRPDPFDAKAAVPSVVRESPFKGYRKFEDQAVTSWRGANELAQKLGGWKAFASGQVPEVLEAQASGVTAPKSAQPQAPAPSGGHAGHTK